MRSGCAADTRLIDSWVMSEMLRGRAAAASALLIASNFPVFRPSGEAQWGQCSGAPSVCFRMDLVP